MPSPFNDYFARLLQSFDVCCTCILLLFSTTRSSVKNANRASEGGVWQCSGTTARWQRRPPHIESSRNNVIWLHLYSIHEDPCDVLPQVVELSLPVSGRGSVPLASFRRAIEHLDCWRAVSPTTAPGE